MSTKLKQAEKKCSFPDLRTAASLCMTRTNRRHVPSAWELSTVPKSCAFCHRLQGSTLKRRVMFVDKVLGKTTVARHDPLLSESRDAASSESDGEELLFEVYNGN